MPMGDGEYSKDGGWVTNGPPCLPSHLNAPQNMRHGYVMVHYHPSPCNSHLCVVSHFDVRLSTSWDPSLQHLLKTGHQVDVRVGEGHWEEHLGGEGRGGEGPVGVNHVPTHLLPPLHQHWSIQTIHNLNNYWPKTKLVWTHSHSYSTYSSLQVQFNIKYSENSQKYSKFRNTTLQLHSYTRTPLRQCFLYSHVHYILYVCMYVCCYKLWSPYLLRQCWPLVLGHQSTGSNLLCAATVVGVEGLGALLLNERAKVEVIEINMEVLGHLEPFAGIIES